MLRIDAPEQAEGLPSPRQEEARAGHERIDGFDDNVQVGLFKDGHGRAQARYAAVQLLGARHRFAFKARQHD